ncbi:endonuclease domain-containing protein [Paludisphaera soli]|uniref:endonuclease domain-containing protein n=1 Tax=Paludisphaera soli TaxID=2712865 RepID=UPI0013EB4CA3|nr:endonuclease domain-containing protein [Paludisphaera soli]
MEAEQPNPAAPLQRARRLRREMTMPERALWRALREAGLKFRRQVPFGPYIVDFYDAARRLAIELDGDSHIGRAEDDRVRQAWLESQNLRVLRISNDDVIEDVGAVVEAILAYRGGPS